MRKNSILRTARATLLAVVVLGSIGAASAQNKVVESSQRKLPVWFNKAEPNYIITSAIASSLEEAQNRCLDNIKSKIIESVAQNVQFSTNTTTEQSAQLGGISDFSDKFSSSLKTQAANVPFIRGVSISKVEESYWQKLQNKQTKAISYLYAIKYPFASVELKKLVYDFEQQDVKMSQKLAELAATVDAVASVEQIDRAVEATEPLLAYFFDDVRLNETRTVKNALQSLYSNIVIQTIEQKVGEAKIVVLLNGKQIAISQIPQLKSLSATQLTYTQQGECGVITYNSDNCPEDMTSEVTATYRIAKKPVVHTLYFNVSQNKYSISPVGGIYLTKNESDSTESLKVEIDIKVENCGGITLEALDIEMPTITGRLVMTPSENKVLQDGIHRIGFVSSGKVTYQRSNLLDIAKVTLRGVCGKSNTPFREVFTLPYKNN